MSKLNTIITSIQQATTENKLLKITLGNKRNKATELKNIFVKPILIKNELQYSFLYRNNTNDITKNLALAEGINLIQQLLVDSFYNMDVYTTTQTIYYSIDKNSKEKLSTKKTLEQATAPSLMHNKEKNRLLNQQATYLHALGITSADGHVKKEMQHKFKQINRYVEIIEGILKEQQIPANFSVVDMGSGKGYLTFALYDYLIQKNDTIQIKGIEQRPDLILKCNTIAAQSTFTNLSFVEGNIQATPLPQADMLIALHACDTATDDAIIKGIKANAQYIICAPCCHKQIRKQIAPSNALKDIVKHGILLERQAEMVTDTIRALFLEAHGYKTKVFDFIEEENTPKNVMIVGTKHTYAESIFVENINKIKALKELFGIKTHYIETLL
jgi:Methyltransferase domain